MAMVLIAQNGFVSLPLRRQSAIASLVPVSGAASAEPDAEDG
jgi:hypothetical protein